MTRRAPMAHRPLPDDLGALPRVTAADWRALLWLVALVVILFGLTAVEPTGGAR